MQTQPDSKRKSPFDFTIPGGQPKTLSAQPKKRQTKHLLFDEVIRESIGEQIEEVGLAELINMVPEEFKYEFDPLNTQEDSFEGIEVTHPLLIAKRNLKKQTRAKPKAWRPDRDEGSAVNIDGKK